MATGLAWDAGSGIVKDNLGGQGSKGEREWPPAVAGVLSIARYSANAGVQEVTVNKDPTGPGACCPCVREGAWLGGVRGLGCVPDASLQEDDGGGFGP